MTDNQGAAEEEGNRPDFVPPPPPNRKIKKLDAQVAKTVLDTDACRSVVSSSHTVKEQKLQEKIESIPTEAPKDFQPIDKYCKATPCGAVWDENATTKRFQVCSRCQLHVYDFTKMDMSEVQNLVYSREGKENPKFYKRADGKFMTLDCPVGKAQQKQKLVLAAIAMALIFGIFLLSNMGGPQPARQSAAITNEKVKATSARNEDSAKPGKVILPAAVVVKSEKQKAKKEYNPADIYGSTVVSE